MATALSEKVRRRDCYFWQDVAPLNKEDIRGKISEALLGQIHRKNVHRQQLHIVTDTWRFKTSKSIIAAYKAAGKRAPRIVCVELDATRIDQMAQTIQDEQLPVELVHGDIFEYIYVQSQNLRRMALFIDLDCLVRYQQHEILLEVARKQLAAFVTITEPTAARRILQETGAVGSEAHVIREARATLLGSVLEVAGLSMSHSLGYQGGQTEGEFETRRGGANMYCWIWQQGWDRAPEYTIQYVYKRTKDSELMAHWRGWRTEDDSPLAF